MVWKSPQKVVQVKPPSKNILKILIDFTKVCTKTEVSSTSTCYKFQVEPLNMGRSTSQTPPKKLHLPYNMVNLHRFTKFTKFIKFTISNLS